MFFSPLDSGGDGTLTKGGRPGHRQEFLGAVRYRCVSPMDAVSIAHVLGTLVAAIALGGMLFFTAIFEPLVFRCLSPEVAGSFMRRVVPVHHGVLAALTAVAILLLWTRSEAPVLIAVGVLFLFVRYAILPRMYRARDASGNGDESEGEIFARLQLLVTIINLAQIGALLVIVVRLISGA
jgi:hypothetical protein